MYNEHQLDAFHQKCVWCPVCNQGFTRHYNLKVHMYKSHGKDYIENNFSAAELAALTKPPPGGSTSGIAKSPSKNSSPTSLLKTGPVIGKHYFDAKNGTAMFSCQMCNEKFVRKSDLYIHLDTDHGVLLIGCTSCEDKFLDMLELQNHVQAVHSKKAISGRRPGPASRTNAPKENRAAGAVESPMSQESWKCKDCIKYFNDKQTYVSHMRLIHGRFFDVAEIEESDEDGDDDDATIDDNNPLAMIIKNLTEAAARKAAKSTNVSESCNFCEKVFDSQTDLRDHIINIHIKGFCFSCELCGKAFPQQENLDAHTKAKHPNLAKRAQNLRSALGLDSEHQGSPAKKPRLEGTSSVFPSPSDSSLSMSLASVSVNPPFRLEQSFPTLEANVLALLPKEPLALGEGDGDWGSAQKSSRGCPVCGVVLSPKTNLKVHLRTHSGDRPYPCVMCDARFRQEAHLMKHFRCAHHHKDGPHVCSLCDFETDSSNDLYRHIAGHHSTESIPGFSKPGPLSSKQNKRAHQAYEPEPEVEEVRYEPITEAFIFEEQIIHPCYVVLPFANETDVEVACNPTRNVSST